jgi:hypothetical protein
MRWCKNGEGIMGNQYRFYLNGANKAKLIKFIVDNGYLVIDNHGNEVDCSLCNEETTFKQLFLYKPEFGKITFIGDKLRIDILTSPIIQLKLTYINDETRFVNHGRIWMSNPIEYGALLEPVASVKNAPLKSLRQSHKNREILCQNGRRLPGAHTHNQSSSFFGLSESPLKIIL